LDERVIGDAARRMTSDDARVEDGVARLEAARQKAEAERDAAESLSRDARALREKAEAETRDLEEKRKKLLDGARLEALKLIEETREAMNALSKDLREIKRGAAKDALREVEAARSLLKERKDAVEARTRQGEQTSEKAEKPLKNLRLGQTVEIRSRDVAATVLTLPDAHGNLQLQAGVMKVRVNIADLRASKEKEETPKSAVNVRAGNAKRIEKPELDLRGKLADEALAELDAYLDAAYLSNLATVTVIHGKGTGALRKAVHEYLKKHPRVQAYRLGVYGEGENGVTVVSL
jgi:DNA mismatch repair protein MutS2